jgi:glycosyltransferase involved in cell wall biosynthesis
LQIVSISLVRNEDRFLRQALLNVARFCDRMLVADHMSTDETPEILRSLSRELDHLEVRRVRNAAESHDLIAGYAGTETWILCVDGDELYDPAGLPEFRESLENGAFETVFRVRPAGLHCYELDESARLATGHLSPPSRPVVGILNFAAIDAWTNVTTERLHGGDVSFREGFSWGSWRHLGEEFGWESSPFRDLHLGFIRRSSADNGDGTPPRRASLAESGAYRRDVRGALERSARRLLRRPHGAVRDVQAWKAEKYERGERVTVDVSPFFASS